jgi:NADH-ubiquinone oxidoreductase chain 6
MNTLNLFLEVLTLLALLSALATITSTNPIIAIVFLIILFINVGIYLILMGLQFIGLSYLLVYVGAITVLFLFIVMMISTEVVSTVEVGPDYSKLLPLAYSIAILFLVLFLITIPSFFVDFTSGAIGREVYSIINSLIFNSNSISTDSVASNNNFSSLFGFIQWALDGFDYLCTTIFGAKDSSIHPLAWAPENMGNDTFSLFLSDQMATVSVQNPAVLNNINLAELHSLHTAKITNYDWSLLFNQPFFVEINSPSSLGVEAINPNGFYYFHPSVNSEVAPYSFPLGWYSADPFSTFTQWVSNKNINLFLWDNINSNYFAYFDPSVANLSIDHAFQPWVNILFANTATNVNYADALHSQWFSSASINLLDIGDHVHSYRRFMLPSVSLHNYFLNLSWLGIPYFPEFLVEFPQSPVVSPLYFENNSSVYHFIERYNGASENVSLFNISAFGDPSTLLHKNLQIQTIGEAIYGSYSILLILSSFLLLLAMVCPIVLARNNPKI